MGDEVKRGLGDLENGRLGDWETGGLGEGVIKNSVSVLNSDRVCGMDYFFWLKFWIPIMVVVFHFL